MIKSGITLGIAAFTFWACWQLDWKQAKGVFYSFAWAALFIYLVLLVRAVVKFVESKTKNEKPD